MVLGYFKLHINSMKLHEEKQHFGFIFLYFKTRV